MMYTQISRPGPCIVTFAGTVSVRIDQVLSMKRFEHRVIIEFMHREAVSEFAFESVEIAKTCFSELNKAMKAWLAGKDTVE